MKEHVRWMASVALLAGLLAPPAAAQQPLDLGNLEMREIQLEAQALVLDAESGQVSAGPFGSPLPAQFSGADLARVQVGAADVMPQIPAVEPVSVAGATVSLGGVRFAEVSDLVASVDRQSGQVRISLSTRGTIDLSIRIALLGLRIAQSIDFTTTTFSATDMGPLFVGRAGGGEGLEDVAADLGGEGPVSLPGPGMVCAMPGSAFLQMDIGIPECAPESFSDLMQMDPTPLDADSGELRAVGVQRIEFAPFRVAGIQIEIAPVPLFDLSSSVLRLRER